MAEFKKLAEELQGILPEGTQIINEQTRAYNSLADSIDRVCRNMEKQAVLKAKYAEFKEAAAQNYDIKNQLKEINDRYEEERKNAELFASEGLDFDEVYSLNSIAQSLYGLSYDDLVKQQGENQKIIDDYHQLYEDTYNELNNVGTGEYINPQRTAAEAYANEQTERWRTAAEKVSEEQKKATETIEAGWKELDHQYAIGTISSDHELYSKKKALLDKYGDSSLEEHWKYYEELYGYEKGFADDQKQLEEDRYEESLKRQEEYSKKSEDTRKKALEDMKDNQKEILSSVQKSLNSIISEYTKAYSEYESNVRSYKAKLLSVGDVFTFKSETDENGNVKNTYTVENIREQMEQMKKYHEYIKKLKAEGASRGLIEELTSMDFEQGAQFGQFLAGMSSSNFNDINELYRERDALAQELVEDMYSDDLSQINSALLSSVDGVLEGLPLQAQAAGKAMLDGLLDGLDVSAEDLSERVSAFSEGFSEMYENAIENMDLKSSFEYAFAGVDAYSMGTDMAAQFSAGFGAELAKLRADVSAGQVDFGVTASGGNTIGGTNTVEEKITFETTINTTVELDGNEVGKSVTKYQNENARRRGA